MLFNPPAKFHKRPAKPRSIAPTGPLVVSDIVSVGTGTETVFVEVMLSTTPAYPVADVSAVIASVWTCRYADNRYVGIVLENVSYNVIRVVFSLDTSDGGANVISYEPTESAPYYVVDALGRELTPFTNMPL